MGVAIDQGSFQSCTHELVANYPARGTLIQRVRGIHHRSEQRDKSQIGLERGQQGRNPATVTCT